MSWKNLFDTHYWFSQPYIAHGKALWLLVGLCLLHIVVGLFLRAFSYYQKDKVNASICKRFSSLLATTGVLGVIWLFLRQERIPFLAWRFWLLILAGIYVWWLSSVVRFAVKRAPQIRQEQEQRARLGKYLPN
ncbi:hypothetical protein EPN28_04010 [Patescibacteria group bacterium]|nr:MAG: hypothetical protein EPN28_04010 [Patescibacteria group bacterium]